MIVQPYLFFNGRAEEAIEFYRTALGAQVEFLMRFKDAPEQPDPADCPGALPEKIMHANLRFGDSQVMISDGRPEDDAKFEGFSLSLTAANAEEAQRLFSAVSEGGQVVMPMGPTFFSPSFGMAKDRFGVTWMIIVMQ